jgi:hypothetical protein
VTSYLYIAQMTQENTPNTLESLQPCSGLYSFRKDLKLNAWLAVTTATYILSLLVVKWNPEASATVRATISLAPLIPGLLYIRSWARFITGLDDLQRRIQLEAWLFAAVGTVLVGLTVDTLNESGIRLGGLEHGLGMGEVFIVAFALWLFGSGIASHRYK